ncbi:hypothetical protein L249_0803 [Ophiocordyceps polyrhachis-furcata BCC 54312]|uniref:Uncharacterized protein n=1 Tax=Ophiocordyceps polyrhachis-furcata BCC 54312 TaxID=1330021 RepID=A0A367LFU7_9HYPO|nr:hypothetical protein L249_0803 [Ophiocordyceps polyrhachis-furcata BCC 54312]
MLLKTKRILAPAERLGLEPNTENYKVDWILNIRKIKRGKGIARTEYLTITIPTPKILIYYPITIICPLPVARRVKLRQLPLPYLPYCCLAEADLPCQLNKIKKVLDILNYRDCLSKIEKIALEAIEKETTTSNALLLFRRALARRSVTSTPTPTPVLSTPKRRRPAITPATPSH